MDFYSEMLLPVAHDLRLFSLLDNLAPRHRMVVNKPVVSKTVDVSPSPGFKVSVDVQQFLPDEIRVSVVDDFIIVRAKHGEILDEHGYISREFTRKYKVPPAVDMDSIKSSLSSDGVLTITGLAKKGNKSKEREVPIVTDATSPVIKQADKKQKLEDEVAAK